MRLDHNYTIFAEVVSGMEVVDAVLEGDVIERVTLESADQQAQARVLSFNIRYGLADDGDNSWPQRRELVFEAIRAGSYDFIGLQEALPFQIEEIQERLPGYGLLSRTREADPNEGEACAIFYRSSRWRLDPEQHGTFWLSATPEEPGSKSWDSSLPRIATWGAFISRQTDQQIYVYNTHFDHRGSAARLESAKLIRAHIAALRTRPAGCRDRRLQRRRGQCADPVADGGGSRKASPCATPGEL